MAVLPIVVSEMLVCVATFPFTVCDTVAIEGGAEAAAAAAIAAGLVTSDAAAAAAAICCWLDPLVPAAADGADADTEDAVEELELVEPLILLQVLPLDCNDEGPPE